MSDLPAHPQPGPLMGPVPEQDLLLQETCEAIVMTAARCLDAEPNNQVTGLALPGGQVVGKQMTITTAEPGGPMNECRISVLDSAVSPRNEVARIEYEHDKQTSHGPTRVYSVQSVRRRAGELVLMENFLAESAEHMREEDFRPIVSESYAQQTVLKTLKEWTGYRNYQRAQSEGQAGGSKTA
jgi:hypothetical protein